MTFPPFQRVMFPKGHVIHYILETFGFQQMRLFCGKVTEMKKVEFNFKDYGQQRYCQDCLKVRFSYTDKETK